MVDEVQLKTSQQCVIKKYYNQSVGTKLTEMERIEKETCNQILEFKLLEH